MMRKHVGFEAVSVGFEVTLGGRLFERRLRLLPAVNVQSNPVM